ncbi:MAG: PD40 domain-containing protein [Saprospiraceae bacterium]|nr:PD40 domain-containing protein [Saprospiraceae bacterium]
MQIASKKHPIVLLLILSLFSTGCISQSTPNKAVHQLVFFQSNQEGSKGHIFLMNTDGSGKQQIGKSGVRPDYYPNWSKDGTKITFESYRRGGWRIWLTDPDGSNARRLDVIGRDYEFDPTFDATGTRVIYSRNGDLYQINVNSGKTERFTNTTNLYESQPDVSIHNEVIYVAGNEDGAQVFQKNLHSGKQKNLTTKQYTDLAPIWSPDASEILFYSDREGGFELFIMNADGSDIRRVISNEALKKHGIHRGTFLQLDEGWNHCLQYRATFSPDGQWITFSANTDDSREIFIVSKDGKSLRQITRNKLHDGFPAFRPITKK